MDDVWKLRLGYVFYIFLGLGIISLPGLWKLRKSEKALLNTYRKYYLDTEVRAEED